MVSKCKFLIAEAIRNDKEFSSYAWCREQDLNLHAFWALDPKSSASANSAIPARGLILNYSPEK